MKSNSLLLAVCVALAVAVAFLWWRVRNLEQVVSTFRVQPSSSSNTVSLIKPQSPNGESKEHVFKLIDSPPKTDKSKTSVGVPWDVERAEMHSLEQSPNYAPGDPNYSQGEWHWDVNVQPDLPVVPGKADSK
jgi:hypothetical protein